MPLYLYTAMDAKGREQKGKINAPSEEAVAVELRRKGMFPTSIRTAAKAKPAKKKAAGGGKGLSMSIGVGNIKRKDLTIFTRQLAILLGAGLPLIRSLHTLEAQAKAPAVRVVLHKTAETVEEYSLCETPRLKAKRRRL